MAEYQPNISRIARIYQASISGEWHQAPSAYNAAVSLTHVNSVYVLNVFLLRSAPALTFSFAICTGKPPGNARSALNAAFTNAAKENAECGQKNVCVCV